MHLEGVWVTYSILWAGLLDGAYLGHFALRTSLRSAMVRLMPASCFHTGSARLRLRGLPVRIAIPSSTPEDRERRSTLHPD